MRRYLLALLLLSSMAVAKDRTWEDATVVKLTTVDNGTFAVAVPIGGGVYTGVVPNSRSYFWIKTAKYTYVIPNYSTGTWSNPWLRLTIGSSVKFSYENPRFAYVTDDEGKDRKVKIIQRILNEDAK